MSKQPTTGRAPGAMPFAKYQAFRPIELPDRQWPNRVIDKFQVPGSTRKAGLVEKPVK